MYKACLFLLLLGPGALSAQTLMNNPFEELNRRADEDRKSQLREKAQDTEAIQKEREFIERFNELVKALSRFSTKYKSDHVIDTRSVESIKKAYRKLEQADPWFKLEEQD